MKKENLCNYDIYSDMIIKVFNIQLTYLKITSCSYPPTYFKGWLLPELITINQQSLSFKHVLFTTLHGAEKLNLWLWGHGLYEQDVEFAKSDTVYLSYKCICWTVQYVLHALSV